MGGFTDAWSTYTDTWAGIWPVSAKEIVNDRKLELQISHRIRVRFNRSSPNVTADMRVLYADPVKGDRLFNIISIVNPDERNEMYDLICLEEI